MISHVEAPEIGNASIEGKATTGEVHSVAEQPRATPNGETLRAQPDATEVCHGAVEVRGIAAERTLIEEHDVRHHPHRRYGRHDFATSGNSAEGRDHPGPRVPAEVRFFARHHHAPTAVPGVDADLPLLATPHSEARNAVVEAVLREVGHVSPECLALATEPAAGEYGEPHPADVSRLLCGAGCDGDQGGRNDARQ